ncbi:MAG TPA: hypothetical protein VFG03_13945 [Telluria sp.]|nr:hypothetical protein [Telluria sp.]
MKNAHTSSSLPVAGRLLLAAIFLISGTGKLAAPAPSASTTARHPRSPPA